MFVNMSSTDCGSEHVSLRNAQTTACALHHNSLHKMKMSSHNMYNNEGALVDDKINTYTHDLMEQRQKIKNETVKITYTYCEVHL